MTRGIGVGAALAALWTVGCGNGGRSSLAPQNVFPSRDALEAIASTPAPARKEARVLLAPSLVIDPSQTPESSPEEAMIASKHASLGLTPTRALRCAADQIARFYDAHTAFPDDRARAYVASVCGYHGAIISPSVIQAQKNDATDAQLQEVLAGGMAAPASMAGGQFGAASVLRDGRGTLVAVFAKPSADVEMTWDDARAHVTLRGVVKKPAQIISALVNKGETEVVTCARAPKVAPPAFELTCPVEPGEEPWVSVVARAHGAVLESAVAQTLLRRDPAAPFTLAPPAPSSAGGDGAPALLAAINARRAAAKLAPLAISPKQSDLNARLVPHFFGATAEVSERIALGLLAGWEVGGTIRDGGFYATSIGSATSGGAWTAFACEMPLGRHVLLDANMRSVAIGLGPGASALVSTYAFFDGVDHKADAHHVLVNLTEARVARGLPKPVPIAGLTYLARLAEKVRDGEAEPLAALDEALSAEANRAAQPLAGWVATALDLDGIELPAELLKPGPLTVGVEVTHAKMPDAAWGYYVVYFVVPREAPQRVAGAPGPRKSASAR